MSLWITDPASTASDWVQITVTLSGTATTGSVVVPGSSAVYSLPSPAVSGYQIYPTGWRSTNVDTTFPEWTHDNAKISFTSSISGFGIR